VEIIRFISSLNSTNPDDSELHTRLSSNSSHSEKLDFFEGMPSFLYFKNLVCEIFKTSSHINLAMILAHTPNTDPLMTGTLVFSTEFADLDLDFIPRSEFLFTLQGSIFIPLFGDYINNTML
jgi:hypothetical protein